MHLLQTAVATDSYSPISSSRAGVRISCRRLPARPAGVQPAGKAVPLDEVEAITEIRKRFVTPGMSLGALSPEAHETLNIAMNRIGAKAVSGEGGEDRARFKPYANGDNANSNIKQIASGASASPPNISVRAARSRSRSRRAPSPARAASCRLQGDRDDRPAAPFDAGRDC
jgi:glutamate synthase (NADPH/NADH) large chain